MYVVCMKIGTGSVANAYEWMKLYIQENGKSLG